MPGYRDPRITRTVSVDALANQPGFLDPYPFRYVLVITEYHLSSMGQAYAQLFWAVEMLEYRGWELTGWAPLDSIRGPGAYMRRVGGAPPPPQP